MIAALEFKKKRKRIKRLEAEGEKNRICMIQCDHSWQGAQGAKEGIREAERIIKSRPPRFFYLNGDIIEGF